ncbi:TPA: DUF333 domain-containing protein [Providencia alcalifaciens]|nr:DUF333 domain-containing protein [Providencia alcalifaciens]
MKRKSQALLRAFVAMGSATVLSILLSACNSPDNSKMTRAETSGSQYAQQVVNLGPGAQEACTSAGGLPSLNLELNGEKTPVCQFANGRRCAVSAIRNGACI